MNPVIFEQSNCVYAENQSEYLPLPAAKVGDDSGTVISCWKLSFNERLKVLLYGKIYLQQLTFKEKLQPTKITVGNLFYN